MSSATRSCRHPYLPRSATEIGVLQSLSDTCDVFGADDGSGLVLLTDDPVEFHPSAKTVNVVALPRLEDAFDHVNVATQTIGLYPAAPRR